MYYFLGYCLISLIVSCILIVDHVHCLIKDYRSTKQHIKLETLDIVLGIFLGAIWPLCVLIDIIQYISKHFKHSPYTAKSINQQLEAYARRKHPEDFI